MKMEEPDDGRELGRLVDFISLTSPSLDATRFRAEVAEVGLEFAREADVGVWVPLAVPEDDAAASWS